MLVNACSSLLRSWGKYSLGNKVAACPNIIKDEDDKRLIEELHMGLQICIRIVHYWPMPCRTMNDRDSPRH